MEELFKFIMSHWSLWLAFVILLFLVIRNESGGSVRGVKRLSPQEVTDLINHQEGVLLDIRSAEEFSESHVNGAKNIPMDEIESEVQHLSQYKNKPIIMVCQSGIRSIAAGVALKRHGFEQIYSLNGGLNAWKKANLPIVKA